MEEVQMLLRRAVAELGIDVPVIRVERLVSGKVRLTLYGGRVVELAEQKPVPEGGASAEAAERKPKRKAKK